MASRLIHSDLFEDDFVGSLSYFERLLWIGLFGAVADDQGRFLDNPAIIRAKVFPYDANVTDDKVEQALVKLVSAGKIIRYSAGGKRLCQIANWWKHQKPSWASASRYPAPEGWRDRVKMHVSGGKVVIDGWDQPGGYPGQSDNLPSDLPIALPITLPSQQDRAIKEVKDEVKGEDEDDVEVDAESGGGEKSDDSYFSPAMKPLIQAFSAATGIHAPIGGGGQTRRWHEAMLELMRIRASPEEIDATCREMLGQGLKIAGPWSILNGVNVYRARQRAPSGSKNGKKQNLDEIIREYMAENPNPKV
jgi:hypothetical protein